MFPNENKEFLELKHKPTHGSSTPYEHTLRHMGANKASMLHGDQNVSRRELLGLKATVTQRMQITLPTKLARLFDIRPGDILRFTLYEHIAASDKLMFDIVRDGRKELILRLAARRPRKPKKGP